MEHFLDKISLEGTRFEKLNKEIDFLGKDGKPLHLIVLAGINGSGKTKMLHVISEKWRKSDNERPPFFKRFSGFTHIVDTRLFKKYVIK